MSKRKSTSKKTRFEIFKRDGFECQYCGNHPPETTLEVDHVNPVANGGDNDYSNLVTSCFECNRGKSDRLLTSVPRSMAEESKRIKEREDQLKEYRKAIEDQQDRIEDDCWAVLRAIFGDDTDTTRPDWFLSVKRFLSYLDVHELVYAGEVAAANMRLKTDHKKFIYFCGVCWNRIRGQK